MLKIVLHQPAPETMSASVGRASLWCCCRLLRVALCSLLLLLHGIGGDWCNLDTGYTTITDGHGYPHSVYISVTRDGSIWMRSGVDHKAQDWGYVAETEYNFQQAILTQDTVSMLESINYTDYCVLTDLDLVVRAEGGWHPSFLVVFDPRTRHTRILVFKNNGVCYTHTNLTLADDKQGFVCGGGKRNTCAVRNLPEKGHESPPLFIKHANLDPQGLDAELCDKPNNVNSYTFSGSFYHAYVKLASCDAPRDSRVLGHEAKLRVYGDDDKVTNTVLIPDPTQTSLANGVIKGWQVFAKVVSIQHEVYLQVWRPSAQDDDIYTLVGQTLFQPVELRFQTIPLLQHQMLHVRRGDVLGLYFPKFNPLAWSGVPCAHDHQYHKYITSPSEVLVDKAKRFTVAAHGTTACRHYSFTAIFANKTDAKLIEDWICPTAKPPAGTRRRSGADRKNNPGGGNPSDLQDINTPKASGDESNSNYSFTEGSIPIHLILIIIGCLILLLIIVGFISYYRAIKS